MQRSTERIKPYWENAKRVTRLIGNGYLLSERNVIWQTVRRLLRTHSLVTTCLPLEDGRVIEIRKPSLLSSEIHHETRPE